MSLSANEAEFGWVEHVCDEHGFLAACSPKSLVTCRCGKNARILRHGRVVDAETLKPTAAKAREVNASGFPFIHGCGDCRCDFGGKTLLRRHRIGGKMNKRCLSSEEMKAKGWHRDTRGRWRAPGAFTR
jgi:hypothetical protein